MHRHTPPAQLPAAFAALPAPHRHIAAAVFAAVFERATDADTDTLAPSVLVTQANAAGWTAARRAQSEEQGQGAGFADHTIRGALYHAWLAAADHRRGLLVKAEQTATRAVGGL